ncbi:MAG: alkaline phosphatase family protein [Vicinamibacterales bacterium]
MSSASKKWAAGLFAAAAIATAIVYFLRPGLFQPTAGRVIVVGLDAADWQLLDGYGADGTMPNLARMVREGRSGILRTIQPPLSPLVWTTMMTGTSPLQHRILDFTRFNPVTGVREPITSDERLEKAVWEMAGDAGRDVAVLGMWATHPAEPVRGLMVSERLFAILNREETPQGVVSPAEEQARVVAERGKVENEVALAGMQAYLPWLTKAEFDYLEGGGDPYLHPVTMLRRILIETRLYHRLALDWVRRKSPALTIVYFEGTDTIGHVFAPFTPPRLPGIDAKDFQRYQDVPRRYFKEVDGMLGEYRTLAEETGAALLIVSDHGFLWHEGRPEVSGIAGATAALWHREEGMYALWGKGIEPDAKKGEGNVGQVAATIMALLRLPRAAGTEGPALAGIDEVLPARNYGPRSARLMAPSDTGPAGDAVERLKALGYVGSNEPAARPQDAGSGSRTPGSFTNEGLLLLDGGKTAEAKAAFEQALGLDPKSAAAKYALASLLEKEGRSPEADDLLLGALADGLGEGPRRVEEIAAAALRQGDAARAMKLLDGAVATLPEDPRLRLTRGRIRLQNRDCRGALDDFDAARLALPGSAMAHGLAGSALMCLGRPAEARRAFEQSLALDPSQTRLRELLARDR